MSRVLALWLTLLAAFWLTRAAASAVLFGTADRSYEGVLQLIVVPVLQALLVAWATRRPGPFAPALPVRAALRQSELRNILLLDAAVLAAGWMLSGNAWFGLAHGRNLPSAWIALKAGAAGLVLGRLARDEERDRGWLLALSAALLGFGVLAFFDFLRPLPELLFPAQPRLLRWIAVHAPLLAAGLGLLLRVQRAFRRDRLAAALALDWAVASSLLAALIAALHLTRLPYLLEPWASLAATCNSVAVTAVLVSVLLAAGRSESRGTGPGADARG